MQEFRSNLFFSCVGNMLSRGRHHSALRSIIRNRVAVKQDAEMRWFLFQMWSCFGHSIKVFYQILVIFRLKDKAKKSILSFMKQNWKLLKFTPSTFEQNFATKEENVAGKCLQKAKSWKVCFRHFERWLIISWQDSIFRLQMANSSENSTWR